MPPRRGRPNSTVDVGGDPPWGVVSNRSAAQWLLRTWRLHGPDPALSALRRFADALSCGTQPRPDASTISRWERLATTMPAAVVARYEQLFDLPTGQLAAVLTSLGRAPSRGTTRTDRRSRTCDLLDRCVGADEVSGAEWLELIEFVVGSLNLLPRKDWFLIVTRLLTEMSISVNWQYLLRLSALHRLHDHPEARAALVAAVAEFVESPSCQVVIDPLALLAANSQRSAQAVLTRLLCRPRDEHFLRAAMVAWSIRVPAAGEEVASWAATVAACHLFDQDQPSAVRRVAADLLAACPRQAQDTAARRAGPRVRLAEEFRSILVYRVLVAPASDVPVVRALTAAVRRSADDADHVDDLVLPRLVHQALYSTNADARVNAANVLAASPFRTVLVETACRQLSELDPVERSDDIAALAEFVGCFGDATCRPFVEHLLRTSAADKVVATAAQALGHLPGRTGAVVWRRVLAQRHHPDVVRAVAYAAGMNQDDDTLGMLRADPRVSRRARWWLDLPTAVQRSARL